MKNIFALICCIFLLQFCSREWNNPLEVDEELSIPEIIKIELNQDNNIVISLNRSYSDTNTIFIERKSQTAFEPIEIKWLSQSTLIDNSFNKELNQNLVYKAYIQKGEYRTEYSNEKTIKYTAIINPPSYFIAVSVELQGIRLEWNDDSNIEENYIIEKNEGNGFNVLTTLTSNTESYLDAISGFPPSPLYLEYRIKATTSNLESNWITTFTEYSGLGSPTNLLISNHNPWNFTIEWTDNSNIESGFCIERKIAGTTFAQIDEVGINVTTYKDTINTTGQYYYRVRTKKDNQYSSYSNEVFYNITSLMPTDGIIVYYPFNSNANDLSGNSLNGTVNGANLVSDRFNNTDGAYNFDGIDDYIEVPHNDIIDNSILGSHTIQIFFKRNGMLGQLQVLLAKNQISGSDKPGFNLKFIENNTIDFFWEDNSLGNHNIQTNSVITDNDWHQIVYVRDSNTNLSLLYLDGVLDNSISISSEIGNLANAPLFIGCSPKNQSIFSGIIDEVVIYDRTLTEEQILALYHDGGWSK